jgi:hypothetical protein
MKLTVPGFVTEGNVQEAIKRFKAKGFPLDGENGRTGDVLSSGRCSQESTRSRPQRAPVLDHEQKRGGLRILLAEAVRTGIQESRG